MNIVYKFCGSYGVDILRNLELKITPPNQFNDPFEFTPRLVCSDRHEYARRLLTQKASLKTLYTLMRSEARFSGSFLDFRRKVGQERAEMIEGLGESVLRVLPSVAIKQLDRVSERHGVLCMSRHRDSILMWGHYCDKACGLVIGFDESSSVFQKGKGLRPVTYVRERVTFDAMWEKGSPEMEAYDDKLIFSKNIDWHYEAELRQFFSLASLTKKPLKNGKPGHFLAIPPSAVVSVTLSPRCSPQFEIEVRRILQAPPFRHVRLDRAVLGGSTFSLSFTPVPCPRSRAAMRSTKAFARRRK